MCCDRHLEIPGVSNNTTGTLEQKKTNSWTPVGQATDKKAPAQKRFKNVTHQILNFILLS